MRDKKETFEQLHQDYAPMVQQMCQGFMKGDLDLAQDLGQETFINIWKALDAFKGSSSPKTWIYRITVN
ncbi:MAG: sigma factor, partial [Bacteroidota bacterium]